LLALLVAVLGYLLKRALRRELGEKAEVEALENGRVVVFVLLLDLYANEPERKKTAGQLRRSLPGSNLFASAAPSNKQKQGRKTKKKANNRCSISSHLGESQQALSEAAPAQPCCQLPRRRARQGSICSDCRRQEQKRGRSS
jgi:hypothetical protein